MKESELYEKVLKKIFEEVSEGMVILSSDERILACNDAFLRMVGLKREQIRQKNLEEFSTHFHPADFRKMMQGLMKEGSFCGEVRILGGEREKDRLAWFSIHTIQMDETDEAYRVAVVTDISDLLENREALRFDANHDALTGLPNRKLILEKLEEAINRAKRHQRAGALFFIDLDNFKRINDTLGHKAGDQVLRECTRRLRRILRVTDSFGRLGGDEFLLVIEDVSSPDTLMKIAQKIIDRINEPFEVLGLKQYLGVSIGITLFPYDSLVPEELLQYADMAMYRAKEKGKNCYQFYSKELDDALKRQFLIEKTLREALQKDGFYLVFQPQIDLRNRKVVGLEALIRLDASVVGEEFQPSEFIPVAEESNLILQIGKWVFSRCCRFLREWEAEFSDSRNIPLSINLSRRQLMDESWPDFVEETLREWEIDPSRIEFEITETTYLDSKSVELEMIRRLQKIGCKISIDDFGTGYSSFSMLKDFSVDKLKIDKSFIEEITSNPHDQNIVKASIALANAMGLEIIAEGVETVDQRRLVQLLGCNEMQGFFFSEPKEAHEVLAFLEGKIGTDPEQ